MKKNLLLLCLTSVVVIFISSCCKEELPVKHETKYESKSITVELTKNQTYQFTLPQNLSDHPYKIAKQAAHFSTSEISTDKIYTYTPAYNYTGKDMVVIANGEKHQNSNCGNNNNNSSNCNNQNADENNNGCHPNQDTKVEQTITIYFIIKDSEQGKNFRTVICPVF